MRIRKFCIREQKYFLLCVHMAFKDQQNLSKVEIYSIKVIVISLNSGHLKDLNSTVAKRGSVFIGVMTSDGAIWFRYQRAVLMR